VSPGLTAKRATVATGYCSTIKGIHGLAVRHVAHHRGHSCARWRLIGSETVLGVHTGGEWLESVEAVSAENGVDVLHVQHLVVYQHAIEVRAFDIDLVQLKTLDGSLLQ